MRPTFQPPTQPLWRGSDRLQIDKAALIGVDSADVIGLSTLDGSLAQQWINSSDPRLGLAASLLRLVGAVTDGPPTPPVQPRIRVEGFGAVATSARSLLGSTQADPAADASVLLCAEGSAEPLRTRGDALARAGTRHIPVYLDRRVDAITIVVGPLVEPATGTSCLRCQHLTRCDRDPAWPLIAAQLSTPDPQTDHGTGLIDRVLSIIAAALAVEQLLAPLGMGSARDGTVEWSQGGLRRRSWPRHPECPLHPAG